MSYDQNMDADLKKSSILNTDYIDLLKIFVEYFKVPLLIRIEPKSEISNYSWSTDFHDYMFWKLVNSFKMMK